MATQSFFCPPAWECEFLVSAGKQVIIVFSRKYVRGRLQVLASEKHKTGTGNFLMHELRWS